MTWKLLLAIALLAAACGDAAEAPAEAPIQAAPVPPGTGLPAATQPPAATTASPAAAAPTAPPATTAVDGPRAADFSLALENRPGAFVLSEAATPVYLTFWAEW